MKQTATVLAVISARESPCRLSVELETLAAEVIFVHDCHAARQQLRSRPSIDVVVTDVSLVDGNWCDILTWMVDRGLDTRIVVRSPLAAENLCAEVLWRGGFDVLVEPYQEGEARRIIESALQGKQPARLSVVRELAGSIA